MSKEIHTQELPPAPQETSAEFSRPMQLGGTLYESNFPEGVEPLENSASARLRQPLKPTALDQLTEGDYFVKGAIEYENEDGDLVSRKVEREVRVAQTELGTVVDINSFTERFTVGAGFGPLMNTLGFVVDIEDDTQPVVAVPTPKTVKHAAAQLGVDIEFFDSNGGVIDGIPYLQTFADGKYPVSLGNEGYYKHDIEDDHLTAMVLGGDPLKQALKEVAIHTLSQDRSTIDIVSGDIDSFTATLRAVISPHHELLGEPYGAANGRRTLIYEAAKLGIDEITTDQILHNAQVSARSFGIEPTALVEPPALLAA